MDGNILKAAIEKWGIDAQIDMMIEECGELITALAKRNREINGTTSSEIITELADVKIVLAQLELIFGVEKVNLEVERKMKRLIGRIYGKSSKTG